MALSCLDVANWSANMNLGVTMSRQRLGSDYFWAAPSPWILWDGFLQSENYSAAIKVSPSFGQIKGLGARWKTFERRKLSFAAKIPTKPVLGPTTDRFVKRPRQQRTNRVDEHYGHKSQWQRVVLYSIQRHCSLSADIFSSGFVHQYHQFKWLSRQQDHAVPASMNYSWCHSYMALYISQAHFNNDDWISNL